MSLQIWLPMTKDLKNQGIADVEITNNGATLDSAGKLGGCYYFNGSSKMFLPSFSTTRSIAFWLKCPKANTTIAFVDFQSKLAFGFQSNGYIIPNNGRPGEKVLKMYSSENFIANEWNHIVLVRDDGLTDVKLYINGNLQVSRTGNANRWDNNYDGCYIGGRTTGTHMTCYINDFRIYDHALSPMEVKHLSQGLVLHYLLDNNGVGNKNISSKYVSCAQGNPDNTNNGGRTKYYGDYGIIIPAVEKADTFFTIWTTESLENGQIYTLSANVSGLIEGTYYRFSLFAQGNSSMGTICFDHNGRNSLTFTMNYTGTVNTATVDGKTYYKLFMDDTTRDIASGQGEITINNIKLEKGSIATPWCPNPSDSLYTALGYDDGIEYDISGYGNNGTKVGTLSYSTDSPRYLASTAFDGTQRIQSDPLPPETQTVSIWVKTTKDKNTAQCIFGDSASALCMFIYSGGLVTYFRGSNGSTGSRVVFGDEYIENGWNHLVVVKTSNTTRNVYCNGIKLTPGNNNYYTPAKGFWIGARNANNQLPFYGQIADIRVYTTQLTDSEIQKLYTVSASIDSNGNAYSAAYVEG